MVSLLERTSRIALDLLFPPRCALCRAAASLLCEACAASLPPTDGPRCRRCWTPFSRGELCAYCAGHVEISFASVRAPFVMDEGARSLVHQLKYGGMSALGQPMGELLAPSVNGDSDVVVPVPLHRGRQRSRGYNQAELLGRSLASDLGVPFEAHAARRVRATRPLARSMNRTERRAIVAGAFAGRPERVAGRRILLVDDVVTTGATLDACAEALLAAGAASVSCVAFARAD